MAMVRPDGKVSFLNVLASLAPELFDLEAHLIKCQMVYVDEITIHTTTTSNHSMLAPRIATMQRGQQPKFKSVVCLILAPWAKIGVPGSSINMWLYLLLSTLRVIHNSIQKKTVTQLNHPRFKAPVWRPEKKTCKQYNKNRNNCQNDFTYNWSI